MTKIRLPKGVLLQLRLKRGKNGQTELVSEQAALPDEEARQLWREMQDFCQGMTLKNVTPVPSDWPELDISEWGRK